MIGNNTQLPFQMLTNEHAKKYAFELTALLTGRALYLLREQSAFEPFQQVADHEIGHAIVMAALGYSPSKIVINSDLSGWCSQDESNLILPDFVDLDNLTDDPLRLVPALMILIAGFAGERVRRETLPLTHIAAHEIATVFYLTQVTAFQMQISHAVLYTALFNAVHAIITDNLVTADKIKSLLKPQCTLEGEQLSKLLAMVEKQDVSSLLNQYILNFEKSDEVFNSLDAFMFMVGEVNKSFGVGVH